MGLSPNDIRTYKFPSQLRGYDKDEVENFVEQVAKTLEDTKQENLKLLMEIETLQTQLTGLKQFEDTIKSAAIDARRNADTTIAEAKQAAGNMLAEARAEAEELITAPREEIKKIEFQVRELETLRSSYLEKFRTMLGSHMAMLEEISHADGDSPRTVLEITDSSEVADGKRETVATQPTEEKGIATEEAAGPESTENQTTAPTDTADKSKPEDFSAIDPELAAALKSYKEKSASETTAGIESGKTPTAPVPTPGKIVETTARAEDIPPGFVPGPEATVSSSVTNDEVSTDKVKVASKPDVSLDSQAEPTEHNTIDPDATAQSSPTGKKPTNLATELDEVVAKFEEEMDKAQKN
jgi:cell division initiation protein